ncbi:hypothetical protein ACFXGI_33010 [Streptomyces sp. NPDC059355]|uniref:hypothetical protein n=1 Tax=Streptomyces sp. NPDC059355 TaxID=3346811 RepID=UPI0036A7CA7C
MAVRATVEEFDLPPDGVPFDVRLLTANRAEWLREAGLEAGTPFLVSPVFVAHPAWRRRDGDGPCIAGATRNREVAGMDAFNRWAVRAGHVPTSPIPQVARRPRVGAQLSRRTADERRPATYARDTGAVRAEWLPPVS